MALMRNCVNIEEATKNCRVFYKWIWISEFPIGQKKSKTVSLLEPQGANLESGGVVLRYQVLPQVASRLREL